jgi:hypothetical protein
MTDPAPDANRLEHLMGAYKEALEAGRMGEAEAAGMELLALAAQQAAADPTPESSLLDEATCCEATADWGGAEAAYRQVLARAEAEDNTCVQFRAHEQLAALHGLLSRHDLALAETRAAVAAARRADLPTMLFMALDSQARCALRTGRVSEALTAVCETIERIEGGALYDLPRGRALALRAACRTALREWPAAEDDRKASWDLLQPQAAMAIAAGAQGALALCWAVTARLRAAQGDGRGAVECWQEAVVRGRHLATLPHVSSPYTRSALARMLHGLGHAFTAEGSSHLADEAFAESRALRQSDGLAPFDLNEPTI